MKKTEKREREKERQKAPEGLVPLLQQYLPILIPHLQQHVKQLVYWKTITLKRGVDNTQLSWKQEAMHATLSRNQNEILFIHLHLSNVFLKKKKTHLVMSPKHACKLLNKIFSFHLNNSSLKTYLKVFVFLPFTKNTYLHSKTMRMQGSQGTLLLTWHCIEVDWRLEIWYITSNGTNNILNLFVMFIQCCICLSQYLLSQYCL